MRLSDLTRLCAERGVTDPIISLENGDGVPVDPAGVEFGLTFLEDHGPYTYLLLSLPSED